MTLAMRIVRNHEEAEEVLQDAFLRAFTALEQFRGDAKFSTWFYRILYNLCMTRVSRRHDHHEALEGLDESRVETSLSAGAESALDHLEEKELREIVASVIMQLPEKFRTPITMFYVQEMNYEEIAATLSQPLGTVKTNLFRGRALLREKVIQRIGEQAKIT